MKRKSLLFLLLFALMAPWAAKAQQSLPYSYGFENNDLAGEGWTAQVTSSSSGIYNAGSSVAYEGTYLFRFNYSESSGYLVSPLLTGTDAGVNLSFFYTEYSSSYGDEQFYVGYTTDETVTDPTAFTYGDIVTASMSWQEYTASLPAGTKRIAISYVYNDAFYLYLDAFSFEAPGAVAKPTDLTVSGITATGATLGWTENGTATTWEICVNDDETNLIPTTTNPYTFTGLTPQTAYSVKVRAVAGGETSTWSSAVSFTTNELCPDGMVCIGSGTATNSYIPTYTYYNYSLTQQIYTAEEIGEAGYILSVDFHCSAEKTRTLDIYMVSTDKTSFSGATDWITVTADNKVFSGSVTFAANDWTTIEFDTPFEYDGRNNVALIVDDNTGSYESSPSFYVFNATSQAIRIYSDGTNYDPLAPTSYSGTVLTQKNRVRLVVGTPPTCPKPKNLAASNVTNHTATLTWTAGGEETQWTVEYGQREDFAGAETMTVNNPTASLTGLDAETLYYVRVKANCSADDESEWTDAISFQTEVACAAPTAVTVSNVEPFSATVSWTGTAANYNIRYRAARGFNYGFETATAWAVDDFAPCTTYDGDGLHTYQLSDWTPIATNQFYGSMQTFQSGVVVFENGVDAAHSGNLFGGFVNGIPTDDVENNNDFLITPSITIENGDVFEFWAASLLPNWGLERMKVGVYGGNGTISQYLEGSATEYVEVPAAWTKYSYDLSAFAGQSIQLAINCVSSDAYVLGIDDLFVGNPNDDTWDVTLNNVASPYTLTGLNDETDYEVQVQSACGGDDGVSEWVGTSFTTPSNCAAPTNLAANDITYSSATLSWKGFHNSYNLQYRSAESREIYYFNDFNDEETEGWTRDYFIHGFTDPIYNVGGDDNYFLEMGWNSTEEETIISCELPAYPSGAHVEFYYFGYQTANTFQVGFSTTTNDADAFTWSDPIDAPLSTYTLYNEELAAGVKYVAWKATASAQEAAIFIDDFGIFGETIPAGAWQTVTTTSPYALTGIADNTEYEWQVQGINPACDGGVTPWSHMATFTTPDACQVPVIDSVNNVTFNGATVYWTGIQDSYNVRYGAFEPYSLIDFNDGEIPADWTNDETYAWAVTDTLTDGGYCIKSTNEGVASSSASISFTARYEAAGVISFDAMFMGEGTSTAWDKCIFSIDGNQYFAYGQIGQEWYNMAYAFAAGEHTFTWTYSKDSSVNPTGDFFAIDNIKVVLHNDTWTTVENVTGNSYDLTDLTPNSVIAVQVQGNNTVCDGGVTEWSSEYLFITPAFTQTLNLTAGWNWVSIYLEIEDPEEMILMLEDALGENGLTIKAMEDGFITYTEEDGWGATGDLEELYNEQMYAIEVSEDCTVVIEGMPAITEEHVIDIYPGWNWIGFPCSQVVSIEDAFADFEAEDGDMIKNMDDFNSYDEGWGDGGDLEDLEPGQGYKFYSASDDDRELVFSTGAKAKHATNTIGHKVLINKQITLEPQKSKEAFKAVDKNCKSIY